MNYIFIAIYFIIFIVCSQLTNQVASMEARGIIMKRPSTLMYCTIIHICILTSSIWYSGWALGIILFALYLFGIIHATIGWILSIKTLMITEVDEMHENIKNIMSSLYILTYITIIFTIISFFAINYKEITTTNIYSVTGGLIIGLIMIIGNFIRIYVCKRFI